jgi:hypothetical protein
MADDQALQQSPAWAALPKSARRVYMALHAEIAAAGGDTATVTNVAVIARAMSMPRRH